MPNDMTDNEYAKHLAGRLIGIADKMEPGDDRSLLFLCAGYIQGQRARIEELEYAKANYK